MSQSLVNETAGARTPLSGFVAALLTLVVVVFFTDLLRYLPQPALAAIVLAAVTGLIQVQVLKRLWQFSRAEFAVSMAAMFGVLGSGLLNGVLIGVSLSLLLLIHRASRPRITEIGRVRGTSLFADLAGHPEREREPDVLVVRSEGALLYFNVDHVRDRVTALLNSRVQATRLVVLFMGNVPFVDLAGAELLTELRSTLRARGIDFQLAEAHGQVRDALRRLGDHHSGGLGESNETVEDVLTGWRAAQT
jgi:anti-anti-sigma factor